MVNRSTVPKELARLCLLAPLSCAAHPLSCSLHALEGVLKLQACPGAAKLSATEVGRAADTRHDEELSSVPSSLRRSMCREPKC